jgi:hypothetical protein
MSLRIQNIINEDTIKEKFNFAIPFFGASSEVNFQFINQAGTGAITSFYAKVLNANFETIDSITLIAGNISYDVTNNTYICNTITTVLTVGFYKLYMTDGVNEYESEEFKIVDLTLMVDD